MTWDQAAVILSLLVMLALFAYGKPRYDAVALAALLFLALLGLVPPQDAFTGLGHPAVVTVAAVLIISRALLNSGIIDSLSRVVSGLGTKPHVQVAVLTTLVAVSSAFINNVGALALFMPVALRLARRTGTSPSVLLMPLAFGSLLGGLCTLIGTPPNIIVATLRAQEGMTQFRMFDFAPVGGMVAAAGLAFLVLVGWRLIPLRRGESSKEGLFEINDYISELSVPEESSYVGKRVRELEKEDDIEIAVVNIIRGDRSFPNPHPNQALRAGDHLVLRANAEDLQELMDRAGLCFAGRQESSAAAESSDFRILEAVIMPSSPLAGRTVSQNRLRKRYGIILLGVSRQGSRLKARLQSIRLRAGDVILLHGPEDSLREALEDMKCLPLAERGLRLGGPRRLLLMALIFGSGLAAAGLGLVPVQVALASAALLMLLAGFVSYRETYESIDWSVVILLGCMIPISQALQDTGVAGAMADWILLMSEHVAAWVTLTALLLFTMFLSDLVNNAAATLLMAPIALSVAGGMGAAQDPFLMAVAIGASCAFLTPVGHQSNTLVMGPGGYRFGDYWRVGLPLELVIAAVAVPAILWVWPLGI